MNPKAIYHAEDDHQCYYRPSCLVCEVKHCFSLLWLAVRYRLGRWPK